MKRLPLVTLVPCVVVGLSLLAASARADIPTGYKGTPFDPAVAGGPKLPASVKGGPYPIPGRLDFINYDMGGDNVGYHSGDHEAKGGAGYRIDGQTATLSWTGQCIANVANQVCMNVWYDTSAALDGTPFPSATTTDFSIGAVQNGDYFNLTVNVATAGTYSLSSTWATGNGAPGGEGGDGAIGLAVFVNGVQAATWSATFPNFDTTADFHHWKAYPNFATVTLTAGLQVIKLQSKAKHLQLNYVQFDLVGADGGVVSADSGTTSPTDGGTPGAAGTTGGTGAAGTTATAGTSGGGAGTTATGAAGDNGSPTGGAGTSATGAAGTSAAGTAGTGGSTTGAAGTGTAAKSSGGCTVASGSTSGAGAFLAFGMLALGLITRARRRRAR